MQRHWIEKSGHRTGNIAQKVIAPLQLKQLVRTDS